MNKDEREIDSKYIDDLIIDRVELNGLTIPVLSRDISFKDKLGSLMVRCGINRYSYEIPPGIYLLGSLEEAKDVIVTCNYRLTIDALRKSIKAKGIFILVLDTYGINVWCAAGKMTFSSRELIYQIVKNDIKKKLKVRRVILPQLGASSMEPHIVRKMCGVSIIYGPIRAEDIDKFIDNSYSCSEEMRTVTFPLEERLKLAPLEFIQSIKFIFISLLGFILYSLIFNGFADGFSLSLYNCLGIFTLSLIGCIAFPAMLPILPFRSFALNNILLSLPFILAMSVYEFLNNIFVNIYSLVAFLLIRLMYAAFIGFRFTGSTTFTSFSGVKKEGRVLIKSTKIFSGFTVVLLILSKVL